jgi:DHA2 family multidrug resistance protein-like MFS transporter
MVDGRQARDTLAGAINATSELPYRLAGPLVDAARGAFTNGMHVAVAVGALVTLVMSLIAGFALRDVRLDGSATAEPEVSTSGSGCEAQPACVGAVGS